MPAGRPSEFSPETAAFICSRIANGESVRKICADPDMPASSTIFKWLIEQPLFSEQYTRAREAQMDAMVEEILEISDDSSQDELVTEQGVKQNSEFINRSRLRVDTRKWLMSKLAPKKYGDKLGLTGGDGEGPIQIVSTIPRPPKD